MAEREENMIYSNQDVEAIDRELDFGTIYQIVLGELGRGRKLMTLTCPKETEISLGMNLEFTIGTTKSGRPRINKKTDKELYMLLSAEGGYTRRGNGTIKVLESQKENFEVLSRGNGADGDAGRIGYWDCMLLRVKNPNIDSIIQVRTSGAGYGTPSDLYVIHEGAVYHCYLSELEECCEALGIDIPCDIIDGNNGVQFGNDWITL